MKSKSTVPPCCQSAHCEDGKVPFRARFCPIRAAFEGTAKSLFKPSQGRCQVVPSHSLPSLTTISTLPGGRIQGRRIGLTRLDLVQFPVARPSGSRPMIPGRAPPLVEPLPPGGPGGKGLAGRPVAGQGRPRAPPMPPPPHRCRPRPTDAAPAPPRSSREPPPVPNGALGRVRREQPTDHSKRVAAFALCGGCVTFPGMAPAVTQIAFP